MSKRMVFAGITVVAIVVAGPRAWTQSASDGTFNVAVEGSGPLPPPPGAFMMRFGGFEEGFDGKVVTGSPYSADAVTERTQMLADGNHIAQKSTGHVYRDSQGRSRREQTLTSIGPWGAPDDLPPLISISDPVASVGYMLDQRNKIAFRHPLNSTGGNVLYYKGHAAGAGTVALATKADPSEKQVVKESLGKQAIEGIQADGTRETVTIAAGAIGNDQPIKIISERWYSAELQTVVLSKHTDPRFGETVYRLTNISRDEPVASLFEVPSDYSLKDGPARVRLEKRITDK